MRETALLPRGWLLCDIANILQPPMCRKGHMPRLARHLPRLRFDAQSGNALRKPIHVCFPLAQLTINFKDIHGCQIIVPQQLDGIAQPMKCFTRQGLINVWILLLKSSLMIMRPLQSIGHLAREISHVEECVVCSNAHLKPLLQVSII